MMRCCALLALAVFACVMAATVLSLVPDQWQIAAALGPVWFNVGHLPAYFILTTVSVAWATRRSKVGAQRLLLTGTAIYVFSLVLEFLQPLVGRTFSTRDLALNAIGIVAALSVMRGMRYGTAQRIARKTAEQSSRR